MGVQARTLEFYRQLGFADEIVRRGIKLERMRLYQGSREVTVLKLGDFGKGLSPYPFMRSLPQDERERVLVEKLRVLGVQIEWNTELTGFTHAGEPIDARMQRNGRDETSSVSFLCGCDGVHSTVREGLQLKFPGGAYKHLFFVTDVAAEGRGVNGDMNFFFSSDEFEAVFPIRTIGMIA